MLYAHRLTRAGAARDMLALARLDARFLVGTDDHVVGAQWYPGRASIERLQRQRPNIEVVHLPIHASWLNQIEIYFSIVQRKVLTPNDFPDLRTLEAQLFKFQDRYQQLAQPFEWRFTRADLARLLLRLNASDTLQLSA